MTIVFMVFAFAALIFAFLLDGGHIGGLWSATAFMIVIGGTIGATGVTIPLNTLKNVGKLFGVAFRNKNKDLISLALYFRDLSTKARKEGLLSLESDMNSDDIDPFVRKGISLAVDGTNPDLIKSILETEIEQMSKRHKSQIQIFESAGGYAPTMGILGTVMGLVHVLSNLEDAGSLGEKIAVAFLATMYGIGTANLLWLPIGGKLKALDSNELKEKLIVIEAVLSITSGDNPQIMMQKLKVFLDPKALAELEQRERSESA
ncbi:MAG: flagellar motor protein [Clostridiales bacterium]|jgi:chemotaxis protein MotA|nr:flagellar motor protein [Clostridiales bacterium]